MLTKSSEAEEKLGAIDKWFASLKEHSRNKEVSKGMKKGYKSAMRAFLKFVNSEKSLDHEVTADEVVEWALSSKPETVLKLLNTFEDWLMLKQIEGYTPRYTEDEMKKDKRKKPLAPNSAFGRAHGIIRGFFIHNGLILPRLRRNSDYEAEAKKTDREHPVFIVKNGQIVKDFSQLRYFMTNLSFRDQVAVLNLLTGAQDPCDLLSLKIGDVKYQTGERIYWPGTRQKTGVRFRTFFSPEATRFLRRYIDQERANGEDQDPLFVSRKSPIKDDKGEVVGWEEPPLLERHIESAFRDAATRMGLTNGETQHPFRAKRYRSIFRTACEHAGIEEGAMNAFMGHKGSTAQKYLDMSTPSLELIYSRVEPYLTVFSETDVELDKNYRERIEGLEGGVKSLSKALAERDEEIKELRSMVSNLAEKVGSIEAIQERLKEIDEWLDTGELKKEAKRIAE